ncbi:hypothetical protein CLAIMM_13681, partial [Cladophialophora immunda]
MQETANWTSNFTLTRGLYKNICLRTSRRYPHRAGEILAPGRTRRVHWSSSILASSSGSKSAGPITQQQIDAGTGGSCEARDKAICRARETAQQREAYRWPRRIKDAWGRIIGLRVRATRDQSVSPRTRRYDLPKKLLGDCSIIIKNEEEAEHVARELCEQRKRRKMAAERMTATRPARVSLRRQISRRESR